MSTEVIRVFKRNQQQRCFNMIRTRPSFIHFHLGIYFNQRTWNL